MHVLPRNKHFLHALGVLGMSASLLFGQTFPVFAIGISPSSVDVVDLQRNTTQIRYFRLMRSGETGDIYISVIPQEKDGPDKMITSGTEQIVMKADQNFIDYPVKISPGTAPNGTYTKYISFVKEKIAEAGREPNVSIRQGVVGILNITVGGLQRLSYDILDLFADPTEVGQDTTVHLRVSNTGNVDWHPDKVVLQFMKTDGTMADKIEFNSDKTPVFPAGIVTDSALVVPAKLDRGDYLFTAAFFYTDQTGGTKNVSIKGDRAFTVYAEGTLAQSIDFFSVDTNKKVYSKGEKIKLDGEFQNTGNIASHAVPVVTITKGDEAIDIIRDKEYVVSKGEKASFTMMLSLLDPGEYKLDTYIDYGAKRTPSKSVNIKIEEHSSAPGASEKVLGALNDPWRLSFIVLLVIVLIVVVRKQMKQMKKEKTISLHAHHASHTTHTKKKNLHEKKRAKK